MCKEIIDVIAQGFLDRLVEPTITIVRRTHWTNGLVTEREVDVSDFTSYMTVEIKRLETAPGIIKCVYQDKRNRVYGELFSESIKGPLQWVMPEPFKVKQKPAESLQDGECPCCRGSWPSPDATKCNGCGYELDEE